MGDVTLGEESSVWYGAVLRGDMAPIVIGAQTNLQDGTIVHVDEGVPCIVGRAGRRRAPGDPARLHRRGRLPDRDGQRPAQRRADRHRQRGGGGGGDSRGDAGAAAVAGHGGAGPDRPGGRRGAGGSGSPTPGRTTWSRRGPTGRGGIRCISRSRRHPARRGLPDMHVYAHRRAVICCRSAYPHSSTLSTSHVHTGLYL